MPWYTITMNYSVGLYAFSQFSVTIIITDCCTVYYFWFIFLCRFLLTNLFFVIKNAFGSSSIKVCNKQESNHCSYRQFRSLSFFREKRKYSPGIESSSQTKIFSYFRHVSMVRVDSHCRFNLKNPYSGKPMTGLWHPSELPPNPASKNEAHLESSKHKTFSQRFGKVK